MVESCLRRHKESGELLESDALFARAPDGLDSVPVNQRRGKLATVTGSVGEIVLDEIGCTTSSMTEHGLHGVDLLVITPEET
ncbi:MAG TPA: hypothetical protein VGO31_10645 [Microbacteriaceae bacterium]|nr:hypothetical protein [Microbacteriaceae bacterium]